MEIRRTEPSFGMAMRNKSSNLAIGNYMFRNLDADGYRLYQELQVASRKCPQDVYLSVIKKNGKEKLQLEVGPKTFTTNIFFGPVTRMKQAVKYAFKLEEEKAAQKRLTEGMSAPKL